MPDLGICLDKDEQVSEALDIVRGDDGEDALAHEGVDMCSRKPFLFLRQREI